MLVATIKDTEGCRCDRPGRYRPRLPAGAAAEATLSAGELGRRLGLSQPAAWRRVRRLEEAGVLAGRRGRGRPRGAGLWRDGLPWGEAGHQGPRQPGGFRARGEAIPEVQVVQHVLGLFDYRLRVVARDMPISSGCCAAGS
jgi:Lrp/AsnC family leucine-responsive transcriptional regulator